MWYESDDRDPDMTAGSDRADGYSVRCFYNEYAVYPIRKRTGDLHQLQLGRPRLGNHRGRTEISAARRRLVRPAGERFSGIFHPAERFARQLCGFAGIPLSERLRKESRS